MRWTISCVAAFALVMGATLCLHGQTVIPIDDFEGPSLDGWTTLDFSTGLPWGPGSIDVAVDPYDSNNHELRTHHTGSVPIPPGTPFTPMYAVWNNSVDPRFSDGLVRAQVRANESENAACLLMRGDLAAGNFYSLCAVTLTDVEIGGQFHIDRSASGVGERLWLSKIDSDITYQTGEEWNVELGGEGDTISAKVWPVGAIEPSAPQFEMTDTSPLPPGQLGFASLVQSQDSLAPGLADASFDNLEFRIPKATGDFNRDGVLDDDDINRMAAEIKSEIPQIQFDINSDGVVNFDDHRYWVEQIAETFYGDADLDKEVQFEDVAALIAAFGGQGGWAQGDFDGDGVVQFPDLVLLADNFGKSNMVAVAVPEPSAALMLVVGVLASFVRQERNVTRENRM